MQLDAYLNRINFIASPRPDLATLTAFHSLHPAAIPFENIDVLLGRGVDISPSAVAAKLVGRRRGGYCFEQNTLFMHVLMAVGFRVEPLIARVKWMSDTNAPPPPRSHMALRVEIDDNWWLADVGFGGLVLTDPLRLEPDTVQQTQHERFRLVQIFGGYRLEAMINDTWSPVYELSDEIQHPVDYEVANWYTSTYPGSKFRRDLMVAKATPEARYKLLNNRLSILGRDGAVTKETLTASQLKRHLNETFCLAVDDQWHAVIEHACKSLEVVSG